MEDVALARLARGNGMQLGLPLGGDAVQTRMYVGYHQVISGLSRGLLSATGGSRIRLVAALGWHLVAYSLPPLLVWNCRGWLVPFLLAILEKALVDWKTGRGVSWQVLLPPLSPLAATPVIAQALRRTQHWRGRRYQ